MKTNTDIGERIQIEVRLHEDRDAELGILRAHLARTPPEIPARYLYDDRGSELFEQICEAPEYYQTRTERRLLERVADDLVERTDAVEIVELGSGASTKTRVLLDAMEHEGQLEFYVPYDVNQSIVERVAAELCEQYPSLTVHGVVSDFVADIGTLPGRSPRLVLFLGGTIGNFDPSAATAFLDNVRSHLEEGDFLLLGTDLIKDRRRLEAAYNDAAGVTAEFNRNVLRVLNRRFGADFEVDHFAHRAVYIEELHRIEMHLVAKRDQAVNIVALDLELGLPAQSHVLTEISVKYDRPLVEELLARSGLELRAWYTDPDQLFALSLAERA